MNETKCNIWDSGADIICITTNGIVKTNGELVMGAGLARQASIRYPELPNIFGRWVSVHGNVPCEYITDSGQTIVSLPTKNDWRDDSDLDLIVDSLIAISNMFPDMSIAMTRPGCGLGGLDWAAVRHAIVSLLDDRFTVYS